MLGAIGTAKLVLKVFGGLIDLIPSYDERRRDTYNKLQGELNEHINAADVDCAAIDDLLSRIIMHVGSETDIILGSNRKPGN